MSHVSLVFFWSLGSQAESKEEADKPSESSERPAEAEKLKTEAAEVAEREEEESDGGEEKNRGKEPHPQTDKLGVEAVSHFLVLLERAWPVPCSIT